jgi:hypothetical protein
MKTMKNLRKISSALILIVMLVLSSAINAQDVSQVRETDPFTGIDVGSIFKVELIQGDNHFVEVTANEDLLDKIETAVRNGVLHINLKGTNRNAKASVLVISPEISSISVSGAATLTGSSDIEAPALNINLSGATTTTLSVITSALETKISGASDLTISGEAEHHTVNVNGAGQLKAKNLVTQTTEIKTSGASHASINVVDYLNADAGGTSSVVFDTDPVSKDVNVSGVASINDVSPEYGPTSSSDTTRMRLGSRDITIVEDIDIERDERRKKRRSFRDNWAGFEMGINGFMAPGYELTLPAESDPISVRYEKSFVYNLNLFQQNINLIGNNVGLVTGVGFTFNNYRFDNQTRLVKGPEEIEFVTDVENDIVRNKLFLTYVNVPLMLEFQTRGNREIERFHIAGGVIAGGRIRTNTKYIYDDDGEKRKEREYKDYYIAPFKLDLTARIGWGKVNLFATYSLNSLFAEGKGPELYPFSVGLRLVSF